MATIYRKTATGQSEIETRAHRLAPRLRTALIMVDGKRSDDELRQLIAGQPDELLQALVQQGFIEMIAQVAPPVRSAPGPAANDSKPPSTLAPQAKTAQKQFEEWRRLAARSLTDQLGPLADALAVRMERARNADELRPLLIIGRDMLGNVRGANAAAAYNARFAEPPATGY